MIRNKADPANAVPRLHNWTSRGTILPIDRIILLFILFQVVFFAHLAAATDETATVKIGVLARRGSEACLQEWSATAQYLSEGIPGTSFTILPLSFQEIATAVNDARVDFIIANPYVYVELQNLYGVSRMATLKRLTPHGDTPLFGGIIFCLTDRRNINSLKDLKGRSVAAVDETSFGGWMVARRELHSLGIDSPDDFAALTFVGTHDDVVFAVRDGKADVGTVATPILEQMLAEGKIPPGTLKILNEQPNPGFPYALSTRLYPEWPFARLKHTPEPLAEKVAVLLLGMPRHSAAAKAAGIAGWTVPFDYAAVETCMRELRVGIYKDYGKITITILFSEYRWQVFSVMTTLVVMTGLLLHSRHLNRKLRRSETALLTETLERRRANDSLHQSLQQQTDIINFLPDATLAVDVQRRVFIWNKAIEKMTGIAALEMIGRDDQACSVPFYGEQRPMLMNLIFEEQQDAAHLYPNISREGSTLATEVFCKALNKNQGAWIFAKAGPLHDQAGNIIGAIESIRDITERKRGEEERKNLHSQLLHAQKMEAIGTLAGGIAHDFNNILGAIIGYAEMAQDDSPAGSRIRGDIDQVVKAGRRAKHLVKQILAFSRQAETEHIPLHPAIIIKEALKMLRATLPSTIAFNQEDIDPEAGLILADPTQIHQILVNLCTNASHAMEKTGGTLNVSLKQKTLSREDLAFAPFARPGQFVQLSVGDTGSGIPPEIKDKIFNPYFTTKETGKGSGMGLAIVHGIVKSYDGFITCHSQLGHGSVFHVFLPVIGNPDHASNTPEEPMQCGHERILLVDDEEMLVEVGRQILEKLGYRVTTSTNSFETLAVFKKQPEEFDLVITDQTMPGMTGIDMARHMLLIRPNLPIILCTGYSNLISEGRVETSGIKGVALKPLSTKDIAALIRRVLDEQR